MQKRIIVVFVLLALSLSVVFFVFYKKSVDSIVYVNSNELFSGFRMTKELKVTGEKELRTMVAHVDSLQNLLRLTSNESAKSALLESLIKEKQGIDEFQNQFIQSNSEKIWSRITIYSNEYAKLKGYDLILNSNNGQPVLAGDKSKDVTNDLLNFMNKKYEGFQ